jgi:hypothetical protein
VTSKSEKRAFDRMKIPGASVIFRRQNRLGFLERFSKPMQLFNLTKSGICFASDKRINKGEPVSVEIRIPGEKELKLYGRVKWINDNSLEHECLIGAQFSAFGNGPGYNPIKSLDRLRILQSKYGESNN